jgi:hypothetical protein
MTASDDLLELARFLAKAKAECYSADEETRIRKLERGGSESGFELGELAYLDRWYGERCFTGEELVWRQGRPCWTMNFYGVTSPEAPPEFPHFHKRALRRIPFEAPFRGPTLHREGDLVYVNDWTGDVTAFRGVERVFHGDREVYRLEYHGGALG